MRPTQHHQTHLLHILAGEDNKWMIQHRQWKQLECNSAYLKFQIHGRTFPVPDVLLGHADPKLVIEPQWTASSVEWKLQCKQGRGTSINLTKFMLSAECNSRDTAENESLVQAASF